MTTLPTPAEVRVIMERRRRFGYDYMSRADFDAIVALARLALDGSPNGWVKTNAARYRKALDR